MSILNPVLPDLDMGKLALYDVLEIPPQHLSNQQLFCDDSMTALRIAWLYTLRTMLIKRSLDCYAAMCHSSGHTWCHSFITL